MALLLAPMEGVLDFVLRDILTRVGGIDRCVSEFIRVTNTLLPERALLRVVPEFANGGRTLAGVPVRPQLLGSDPQCLAENAALLSSLGPFGVDLNFGCPAKVVNRHGGGAALLVDPELLFRIVSTVRRAVPSEMPVSAKMRLGYADDRLAEACAQAITAGGATELVVHARTGADAYRPPAYWARVNDLRQMVSIPVIANGEIWCVEDALRCRTQSGCSQLMIGRGMVANPGLAREIQSLDASSSSIEYPANRRHPPAAVLLWKDLFELVGEFWLLVCERLEKRQQAGRLKQWLNFLRRAYPQAQECYLAVRTLNEPNDITLWLLEQGMQFDRFPEHTRLREV